MAIAMNETTRKVPPLIDLTGWDELPERYEPLSGQRSFLDAIGTKEEGRVEPSPFCGVVRHELFETGRDLPGAKETAQDILWDI